MVACGSARRVRIGVKPRGFRQAKKPRQRRIPNCKGPPGEREGTYTGKMLIMPTLNRAKVTWTNFTGGPGLSTFYFGSSVVDMTALRTFFSAIAGNIPSAVTINVPSGGDQISDVTGQITGIWSGPAQAPLNMTGGVGNYSGTSGLVVDWLSSAVVNGRRPIGKTFIVPTNQTAYDTNGSIATAVISSVTTAAMALLAAYAGELKVFSRPFTPPAGSTKPARIGSSSTAVAARVPDLAVVLRSRRI